MNFFLYINRKLVFIFGITIILIFLSVIFSKHINQMNIRSDKYKKNVSKADIDLPRFTINNEEKKIYVSAKEGNFLSDNNILLSKNVRFKSNDFSIETEKVIFNRTEQTANSKSKSLFKAKNTIISSDGFNIFDKGDKIVFYGKSFIVLK